MLYLAIGGAILAAYLWLSGGRRGALKRREWRVLSGVAAVAAFTAAAFTGVRGAWGTAVVLLIIGLWLAASARKTQEPPPPAAAAGRMSEAEARRILGVGADATSAEIKAAHARLIRTVHPDKGGTEGLAAQLNMARDRLLKR